MASTKGASERRKEVFLGELPNDFLRLGASTSSDASAVAPPQPPPPAAAAVPQTPAEMQIAADEQAARALQQQLNGVPPAAAAQYYQGGAGFVPPNTRGRLSLTVVEAKLSKNYGLVRMDPYCRLRVGTTVFETPTNVSGGKTPKWNRTVHCYLPEGIESVYLEIFDERAFTTDERIAWSHIGIPAAVFNNETIDDWYALSGQQGEGKEGMVNLILAFAPVDAPPVQYVPMTQAPVMLIPGVAPAQGYAVPQGVQPPPEQLYTEDDVKELEEMFPNIQKEVVVSVLDEKRGNKDAAVNALLSMSAD